VIRPALILIPLLLCACLTAQAAEKLRIQGTVTRVVDGDTLDIGAYRIRLAEIDAPEKGQPGGLNAKAFLEAQVFGKRVTVSITDKDRYGRYIGYVTRGTLDVNAYMVEAGWAWVYEKYAKEQLEKLKQLESEAQQAKRGIWAQENPVAPWDWRKKKPPSSG
jgi:endonuclease YncB( thermonuclease family)